MTSDPTRKIGPAQLEAWDLLIREGEASKVRALCRKLNHKKVPRHLLVDYAQIARRVGLPELILLWLRPIVRSDKPVGAPTPQERALYGLGLLRLGAFREAKQILGQVRPEDDPQVRFYRASLHINQWNYRKAIPELRKYIHDSRVPDYARLVGRLNLCTALVATGKFDRAAVEIDSLMAALDRRQLPLLTGNLLEIRSQYCIETGRYTDALADLSRAAQLLAKADARTRLYVEKWETIIQSRRDPRPAFSAARFGELRARALVIGDWETVRDCDLHLSGITGDRDLLLRVFWGSRFPAYKRRILETHGRGADPGREYCWHSADGGAAPEIDLIRAAPTAALKRLFFILTREFYQPLRITELTDFIYPGQHYHPVAGPMKVHRLVARARAWVRRENLPLEIKAFRNAFKLEMTGPCRLLLRAQVDLAKPPAMPPFSPDAGEFTARQWAAAKAVSVRTARREIHALVRSGHLQSRLFGPRTRYRFS